MLILGELFLRITQTMSTEPQAIEVEVIEIDGVAPAAKTASQEPPPEARWQNWQKWQGRVRQLDGRWWPLWVFLGAIALVLLLTVGLVVGVVFLVFRILTGILRAFLR